MKTLENWLECVHQVSIEDCEGIKATGIHDLHKKLDVHYYDDEGNYEESIPKTLDQLLELINDDTPDGWRDYGRFDWLEGWNYMDDTMRRIHPSVSATHFMNLFAHTPDFQKVLRAIKIDDLESIIAMVNQYNPAHQFSIELFDGVAFSDNQNQFVADIKRIVFMPDGVTGTYSVSYRPESISYIALLAMDISSDFMCTKSGGPNLSFNFDDVNKLINFLETGVNAYDQKGALHAL